MKLILTLSLILISQLLPGQSGKVKEVDTVIVSTAPRYEVVFPNIDYGSYHPISVRVVDNQYVRVTGQRLRTLPDILSHSKPVIKDSFILREWIQGISQPVKEDSTPVPILIVDCEEVNVDVMYSINTSTIEAITILKPPASKAMYGVRGINGVIVITTKKGCPDSQKKKQKR